MKLFEERGGNELMQYSNSILASYATFKELYNSNKYSSPYQILSEFIKYVIISKNLYSFSTTDIQTRLQEEFGFKPPIAVIRTAMKNISFVEKNQNIYRVINNEIKRDSQFKSIREKTESESASITEKLILFASHNGKLGDVNKEKLSQEFISLVLDEQGDDQYQQLISEFILANKDNDEIKNTLHKIREGSILYTGLAYNISEFGSLKKPITIFLDTEILFDIIGLNGEIYKTLADDFLSLVDTANKGRKVIILKYFDIVKDDIENFYGRAEKIVDGKGDLNFSPAMKNIVTGCGNVSDVQEKQVEFFRNLHIKYGIRPDDKKNYYTPTDLAYNLEGELQDQFSSTDPTNYEGLRFCSHINKLRKGYQTNDLIDSRVVFVTDTRRVLDISNALTGTNINSGERCAGYATSLSGITNLLWYKLNRGFGSTSFPKNLDVVIKAQVLLSSYIKQEIATTYKDIKNRFNEGTLNEDQVASYIVALRKKPTLPENIKAETIQDDLSFSDDYLNAYSENISKNKQFLAEKDEIISNLNNNVENLKKELQTEREKNTQQQDRINELSAKVDAIEKVEQKKAQKKNSRNKKIKLLIAILWKIVLAVIAVVGIKLLCDRFNADYGTWLSVGLGIVGCLAIFAGPIKKDWKKYKEDL